MLFGLAVHMWADNHTRQYTSTSTLRESLENDDGARGGMTGHEISPAKVPSSMINVLSAVRATLERSGSCRVQSAASRWASLEHEA